MRTSRILSLIALVALATPSCGGGASPNESSESHPAAESSQGSGTGGSQAASGSPQGSGTGGSQAASESPQGSGTGGNHGATESPQGVAIAKSALVRATDPSVPEADQTALREGNTAFAIDLLRSVRAKSPNNVFLSPYSITSALCMTYAGARGNTEAQLTQALHITLPQERLHPAMNQLDALLHKRQTRLDILNAAWVGAGASFLPAYLDVLALDYGAGMYLIDLDQREHAVAQINQWVSDNTQGKIPSLLDNIAPNSALVLTNAIYFHAAWKTQFDSANTRTTSFTRSDGTTVDVSMMHETANVAYGSSADWQAVEIPYSGDELSFVAVSPKAGTTGFEQGLTAQGLESILGSLVQQEVSLGVPKFTMGSKIDLVEQLEALGATDAFGAGQADFSGMDGQKDLFISKAVHEAKVEVSEAGTEAAAASAVVVTRKSIATSIALDHPFLFLVRDVQTRTILFLGWVADPTAG